MPYLSRIRLNPLRRQTQRLLENPQRMHAEVLGGVPGTASERLLWRVDRRDRDVDLYVVSQSRPSWAKVVEEAGWPGADGGGAEVRDYAPVLDLVVQGREFSFRVRANPVWRTRRPQTPTKRQREAVSSERPRGVRVAALAAANQVDWFVSRSTDGSARWGFSTEDDSGRARVRLVDRGLLRFRKSRGAPPVTVRTATFEGVLTVVDPERFREVLTHGLGSGKAYGCGLLTLAPVQERSDVVAG